MTSIINRTSQSNLKRKENDYQKDAKVKCKKAKIGKENTEYFATSSNKNVEQIDYFSAIPEDVCIEHIISKLQGNDLLNINSVSQYYKRISELPAKLWSISGIHYQDIKTYHPNLKKLYILVSQIYATKPRQYTLFSPEKNYLRLLKSKISIGIAAGLDRSQAEQLSNSCKIDNLNDYALVADALVKYGANKYPNDFLTINDFKGIHSFTVEHQQAMEMLVKTKNGDAPKHALQKVKALNQYQVKISIFGLTFNQTNTGILNKSTLGKSGWPMMAKPLNIKAIK